MKPPPTSVSTVSDRKDQRTRRTNPPRKNTLTTKSPVNSRNPTSAISGGGLNGPLNGDAHGFFPAITHFTDGITALPQEIIRHFTLLKEVDAKACSPEELLSELVKATLLPPPKPSTNGEKSLEATQNPTQDTDATTATLNGDAGESQLPPPPIDPTLVRRHLFHDFRTTIADLLTTLDEKNHVIATANEALAKQLSRVERTFEYVQGEISEEVRWGNVNHWAYGEKGATASNGVSSSNRVGIDGTNSSAGAAGGSKDGARADTRRDHSKRHRTIINQDADLDDHRVVSRKHRDPPSSQPETKKLHGNSKVRKAAEAAAAAGVAGMGASATSAPRSTNPPAKRRKTEKAPNGISASSAALAGADKAMGSPLGPNGGSGRSEFPRDNASGDAPKRKPKPANVGALGNVRKRSVHLPIILYVYHVRIIR